jgi:hypothetical protein
MLEWQHRVARLQWLRTWHKPFVTKDSTWPQICQIESLSPLVDFSTGYNNDTMEAKQVTQPSRI